MEPQVLMRQLSVAGVVFFCCTVNFGQQPESSESVFRTWNDKTGRFSVVARLIDTDGTDATLLRKDDRQIKVPIARMSEADQRFLSESSNPFEPDVRAKAHLAARQLANPLVVVWCRTDDQMRAYPGYVFTRKGDEAYVYFTHDRRQEEPPSEVNIAVPQPDGTFVETPSVLSKYHQGVGVLRVAADQVPPCMDEMDPGQPMRSSDCIVVGLGIEYHGDEAFVASIESNAKVTSVYRARGGSIERFSVSGDSLRDLKAFVVLDGAGQLLGLGEKLSVSGNSKTLTVKPPATVLNKLKTPQVSSVFSKAIGSDGATMTYSIRGDYVDWLGDTLPTLWAYPLQNRRPPDNQRFSQDAYPVDIKKSEKANEFEGIVKIPRQKVVGDKLVLQTVVVEQGKPPRFGHTVLSGPNSMIRLANVPIRPDRTNARYQAELMRSQRRATPPATVRPAPPIPSDTRSVAIPKSEQTATVAASKKWMANDAPRAEVTSKEVGGPEYDLDRLATRALTLEAVAANPIWSPDGNLLYAASQTGFVSRIEMPGCVESHRLSVGGPCNAICHSKSGIVVHVGQWNSLLVLDPASLEILNHIEIGPCLGLAGSPAQPHVYVLQENRIVVVDAARGIPVARLTTGQKVHQFNSLSATQDGRYLFVGTHDQIGRYAIDGDQLTLEELSGRMGGNARGAIVCADSKHVAMPCGGGNRGAYDGFQPMNYGTYLFGVDDLKRPKLAIRSGPYPRAIDIDPVTGQVFAQNHDSVLLVYSQEGIRVSSHEGRSDANIEFVARPSGGSVLIKMDTVWVWSRLPMMPVRRPDGSFDDSEWLTQKAPRPVEVSEPLADPVQQRAEEDFRSFRLSQKGLACPPLISSDGQSIYTISAEGLIQRISTADFVVRAKLDLHDKCTSAACTAEGPVIAANGSDAVYLLDPLKLEIKRRILTNNSSIVLGGSRSSVAVALDSEQGRSETFSLLDLARGRVLSESNIQQLSLDARQSRPGGTTPFLTSARSAALSPDGKHLFLADRAIHRYRIDGDEISFEAATAEFGEANGSLSVSPDGRQIVLVGTNMSRVDVLPKTGRYGLFVFNTDNFSTAKTVIDFESRASAFAFDAVSRGFYGQSSDGELVTYAPTGDEQKSYKIAKQNDRPWIVASPLGGQVLVVGENGSQWLRLHDKEEPPR